MYVTRQFPLAGCCSETVRATGVKFAHRLGRVQPFDVSTFRGGAGNVVRVAGASFRILGRGRRRAESTFYRLNFFAVKIERSDPAGRWTDYEHRRRAPPAKEFNSKLDVSLNIIEY